MENPLKIIFIRLVSKYTKQTAIQEDLWAEIKEHYSSPNRYYHTLLHLENVWVQLDGIKQELQDVDSLLFALFYHDVIYHPNRTDNEEKSAEFAEKRMLKIPVPREKTNRCKAHILATKSHSESSDSDTNHFIDADLSILGQEWETYSEYFQNVRKEYINFPDFIYNPGRKKLLKEFLKSRRIFKTEYFYQKIESQARENIQREIEWLNQ